MSLTLVLLCRMLLLVSQQHFLLAPAMLLRETQYILPFTLSLFFSLEPSSTLAMSSVNALPGCSHVIF